MVGVTAANDPVEAYLDRLVLELRGRTPDVRRVLSEVEDHLHDVVAEYEAAGSSPEEARTWAVDRMGPPRDMARRFTATPTVAGSLPMLRKLVVTLAFLGGIGLVAVGVSGLLAAGMGAAYGKDFVAGDSFGVTYTKARCAEYLEYEPHAGSCAQAAEAHHYGEVVGYRLDAGVLGLLVLGGAWIVRRRRPDDDVLLPEGFVPIVAVTLYGAAAGYLLLDSLGQGLIGGDTNGVGQFLSGGLVAAAMAAVYLVPLARTLLVRPAPA
jgi:hypothetical protein